MKRSRIGTALWVSMILLLWAHGARAFQKDGCATAECRSCHTLNREQAAGLLAGMVDNVLNVEESPVNGLWVVDILKQGRKFPIYIDYSKEFLISGQVVRLKTKEDITGTRFERLNEVTVNPSEIPLEDALVLGNPAAKQKIIVFSDPDCHFCGKLHQEFKAVIEKAPDVAFYVKIYSRTNNPAVAEKARAVICSKSLSMMEDAYTGKTIPPPTCTTQAVEETFKLAQNLKLQGTPALILPNGKVVNGFRPADVLLQLLAEAKSGTAAEVKSRDGGKKP